ncbi:MAG: sugar ABC transporter permease [Clostridia bacterium]|nr:sugar ABC transporter permease [Clostridia bacterium]
MFRKTSVLQSSSKWHQFFRSLRTQKQLWMLCIPIIIWVIIFNYYPMYGVLMAFVDFMPGRSIFECRFVGFKHFIWFVTNPAFPQLMRNTLAMSGLGLTLGFIAPILFSLLLNEIGHLRVKKMVQTISYLPHFISWVAAGSIVFLLLSSDGVINSILKQLNLIEQSIPFLTHGPYYWMIYTLVNMWKGIGWSSIIYLSAIAGIDEELYQAGAIDGLGRLGMAKYITLPSILPTIVLLWIMGIGGILNAGFEQHLIIGNPMTQSYWDVLDTFSYRYGVQQGYYSMGTAVSLMKSVIGFILVYLTNRLSKRVFDVALF